jgi:hypothetical protein
MKRSVGLERTFDRPFPDDLLNMVATTFALTHKPLVKLLPDYPAEQVVMLARTLFSAVHGIISLGIEDRLVAVPPPSLRLQLSLFVDTYLAGLEAYVPEPPSDLAPER